MLVDPSPVLPLGGPPELVPLLVVVLERHAVHPVVQDRDDAWDALGQEAIGDESDAWTVRERLEEAKALMYASVWISTDGNITHAADRCDCSRRVFREHFRSWHAKNPRLLPHETVMQRLALERRRAKAAHVEGHWW